MRLNNGGNNCDWLFINKAIRSRMLNIITVRYLNNYVFKTISFCGFSLLIGGCLASATTKNSPGKIIEASDLVVVDCLLPGQIRRLGATQYIANRRAIKTTQHDCALRGGEYVAYDRANYTSAINIWLPQAMAGDAVAQNYVGEIYEKGTGDAQDYQQAAYWYQKAAANGNARAALNMASLYERGVGVERNLAKAVTLYRKGYGLNDEAILVDRETQQALKKEVDLLQERLVAKQQAHDEIAQKLRAAQTEVENKTTSQLAALRALYETSLQERAALESQVSDLAIVYRNAQTTEILPTKNIELGDSQTYSGINFGRYYALIIGNQTYNYLTDLKSPVNDAKRLQMVLEQRYGFKTQLIENGSEKDILMAINQLFDQLNEEDNLLVFYAGHGELSKAGSSQKERGYWLPVDAQPAVISHWLNNAVISDHLDRIKARSVLVLSDSCYAGNLGAEKSPLLFGLSHSPTSTKAIKAGLKRRARIVISSGGERPVIDGQRGQHSVFAGALIDVLERSQGPIRDSQLFSLLSVGVSERTDNLAISQKPQMKPIREAGHQGGNFFFIPR